MQRASRCSRRSLASRFFARDRFLHVVAAIIVAAPPAIDVGVRLVAKAPLTVVATALFVASTLVPSRPLFFRRRRSMIVALAALSTLAHHHAVAFVDCCVLRVHIGSHSGHDRDRRDRNRCVRHRHRLARLTGGTILLVLATLAALASRPGALS